MPDDSPRPTPGNWPEQRNDAQPGWWTDLGRTDLPDDRGNPTRGWIDLEALSRAPEPPPRSRRVPVLMAVAGLILGILGVLSVRSVLPHGGFADIASIVVPVLVFVIVAAAAAKRPPH